MAWNAARPDGGLPWSQGDDDLRANFAHLEEALSRLFTFPGTAGPSGTSGIALPGSARAFFQSASPTTISALASLFSGALWVGDTDRAMRVYTGSAWALLAGAAYQASAPSSPSAGSLWVDSDNAQQYVYNGSIWVPARAKPPLQHDWDFDSTLTQTAIASSWVTLNGLSVAIDIPAGAETYLGIVLASLAVRSNTGTGIFGGCQLRISENDGTTTTTYSESVDQFYQGEFKQIPLLLMRPGIPNGKTYTYTVEGISTDAGTLTVNFSGSSQLGAIALYRGD